MRAEHRVHPLQQSSLRASDTEAPGVVLFEVRPPPVQYPSSDVCPAHRLYQGLSARLQNHSVV